MIHAVGEALPPPAQPQEYQRFGFDHGRRGPAGVSRISGVPALNSGEWWHADLDRLARMELAQGFGQHPYRLGEDTLMEGHRSMSGDGPIHIVTGGHQFDAHDPQQIQHLNGRGGRHHRRQVGAGQPIGDLGGLLDELDRELGPGGMFGHLGGHLGIEMS